MRAEEEEVLYGGAMGSGKSLALRAWGVTYCLTHPGAQIVLFRRNYRELEDTHILQIQKEVPVSIAMYSSGSHNLVFRNGSIFQFRYCEEDSDVRTYFTSQYECMLFDEITEFSLYQYTNLITRCRSTSSWWPGRRIRVTGMPLGIGHEWVKARWVDPQLPNTAWRGPSSEGGLTRRFIPAKYTDNPALVKSDPTYLELLKGLPHEEYRARALGDWSVALGQFFSRWRPEIHVVDPFDVPPDWHRFICVDYGFNAPYCALWFARPPGTLSAFFYREHYGRGVPLSEQVYRAWEVTNSSSEKIQAVVLDPSMFNKVNVKGERIDSMADDWIRAFGKVTNVIRGKSERVSGWRLMREMIDWTEAPDGKVLIPPRMFVFKTCSNLARTLPSQIRDEHNVEDINTDGEDHPADAARYGLMHAFAGAGNRPPPHYRIGPRGIYSPRSGA